MLNYLNESTLTASFAPLPQLLVLESKKVYDVNDGIQIRITDEVRQLDETIRAYQDPNGNRYIRIKTNNELTYRRFCSTIQAEETLT